MNKIILLIGIVIMLSFSGCYSYSSSHDDCMSDCLIYGECKDTFEYEFCSIFGKYDCSTYDLATAECKEYCYNECKPKEVKK